MNKTMFKFRQELFKRRRDLGSIILYSVFGILLLLLLYSYIGIYKPLKNKYVEQMNSIYTYNANIQVSEELPLISEIMNEKVNEIRDVHGKLSDIVPDKRNVPFVTSQIALAAQHNNVNILSMSKMLDTSVVLGKDTFGVAKYSLSCVSLYEELVNLLATLETTNSIFAIEKVTVSPLAQDEVQTLDDLSLVKTDLIVNIYMKAS